MLIGCRITGGGSVPQGDQSSDQATFGGQVGAPCGCIGCFDELGSIQGNWQHSRKDQSGSLHAKNYNSLICGCDGVMQGSLCNPGDRSSGPEPPRAPANMICFSGVADFTPTNGQKSETVAFRVEAEDRGEPGSSDSYTIRIWIPRQGEVLMDLADEVCCTNSDPQATTGRSPDIEDGGTLTGGNIQIHPETPKSSQGVCPPPNTSCPAS